jgi:hypothetical protein
MYKRNLSLFATFVMSFLTLIDGLTGMIFCWFGYQGTHFCFSYLMKRTIKVAEQKQKEYEMRKEQYI